MLAIFTVFSFIWGAIWGSFLNVVIYRLPRGLNLAVPGSACPSCKRPIPWYENVPLLSWLLLRAKCRGCGTSIAPRYFVVELLTALLSTALFWKIAAGRFGDGNLQVLVPYLFYFAFLCSLISVSVIDLELTLIPDIITIPTAILGLIAAFAVPESGLMSKLHPNPSWLDSLIGALGGAGLFAGIAYGYKAITGRIGLGGGDFTMIAMIGAFLGWQSLPIVMLAASVQGLLYAIGAAILEKIRGEKGGVLLRGVHKAEFWENKDPRQLASTPDASEVEADPSQVDQSDTVQDSAGEVRHDSVDTAVAEDATEPDDLHESTPGQDSERQAEEADRFGTMGIPFGPFLALGALEYLFIGELIEKAIFGLQ
ncbi:MAG: prepilin peptidase [Myxococcales bacterium]|nr:prepilin peptidase [Myxococcales bacterium]